MINRIIIAHLYQPSTAATNRIFAYAKSFSQDGCEVHLVLGCEGDEVTPSFDGVNVIRAQSLQHMGVTRKMAEAIKGVYRHQNCAILIYGSPLLCWYLPKKRYNIFYECTEVPFYGRKKTVVSMLKEGIKRYLSKRATGMLVISQALKHYFESQGIKNIVVINMFVDAERFDEERQTASEEKYVGYCGTISPFKDGVNVLLKAFALFRQSHLDYTLKLIGRFESEEAEQYLKTLVKELCITESVNFTGMVSPEEMPRILCGAKLLALARPENEQAMYGFPTKLGEYLATGRPVVVTNVGEIGFFLKDMENCRMAKPSDEQDFADKMNWVADNYEEALHLGRKGKGLTKTEFSCRKQSKRVLAFMESVIGQNIIKAL